LGQDSEDSLPQRTADAALYRRLASVRFAGPDYQAYIEELAAYGIAVCEAWLVMGLMFQRCARQGRPIGDPPTDWSADDRRELVLETVTVALRDFREYALVKGEWKPDAGSSLKTYFIGGCVFAFPNVYRSWKRERDHWAWTVLDEGMLHSVPVRGPGPEDRVLEWANLRALLASLDQRTAAVVMLGAEGYSQEEIAEILDVTKRAVEGLLYRHRKRWAECEKGGGDHDERG
jgi:DNA-directed RNA polymerase specialized sigma24 family protein